MPLLRRLGTCVTADRVLFSWRGFSCGELLCAGRERSSFVLYLPTCVTRLHPAAGVAMLMRKGKAACWAEKD